MTKTQILYSDQWNPNKIGDGHIAISTQGDKPYVWRTYHARDSIPESLKFGDRSMILIPRDIAFKLFDFIEEKKESTQQ